MKYGIQNSLTIEIIGAGERFVKCPKCGSFDRERLIFMFLSKETDFFKKRNKVLHFAPEKNLGNKLKQNSSIDYYTVDLYSHDVMFNMDITDMDFDDNSFNYIICNHVLEHVIDDKKAMGELYRILKKGGKSIIQVPFSPDLINIHENKDITGPLKRLKEFGQTDHVRIYSKEHFVKRLINVGFDVRMILPGEFIKEKEIMKQALNPNEYIFLCSK